MIKDPKNTIESTTGAIESTSENIIAKIKALPEYIEQAPAAFQAYIEEISAIEDPYKKGEALGTLVGNVLPAGVATNAFVGKTVKTVREFNAVKKGAAKGFSKGVNAGRVRGVAERRVLVPNNVNFSDHAVERLVQRGITKKMADVTISKGVKFYDPKNKSINYVLKNAFGTGKDILIGTDPLTGEVRTVLRGTSLIRPRMLPIE